MLPLTDIELFLSSLEFTLNTVAHSWLPGWGGNPLWPLDRCLSFGFFFAINCLPATQQVSRSNIRARSPSQPPTQHLLLSPPSPPPLPPNLLSCLSLSSRWPLWPPVEMQIVIFCRDADTHTLAQQQGRPRIVDWAPPACEGQRLIWIVNTRDEHLGGHALLLCLRRSRQVQEKRFFFFFSLFLINKIWFGV